MTPQAPTTDLGSSISNLNPNSNLQYFHLPSPIAAAMFLQRSAIAAARRAAVSPIIKRSFTSSIARRTLPLPRAPPVLRFTDATLLNYRRCSTTGLDAEHQQRQREDKDLRSCVINLYEIPGGVELGIHC